VDVRPQEQANMRYAEKAISGMSGAELLKHATTVIDIHHNPHDNFGNSRDT